MVSSTFFDLQQVRADLLDFIQGQAGYQPLLSEQSSFPVDADLDTIENCRRRVERDADLLILVIGGRYGSIGDKSARSVTNLEYLAARSKGIPIFAFVKREVLTALTLWEKNPTADFSSIADTSKLFEFVREVRSVHKVWTHQFDTAQDIVVALRSQFAHLAAEGIRWKEKLRDPLPAWIVGLRGRALMIALERPRLWEHLLLVQAIRDELDLRSERRREHELGLYFQTGEQLQGVEIVAWSQVRMREIMRIGNGLTLIFGQPVIDAMGPPGEPGNPELIIFVARKMGAAYEASLDWARRVRTAHADEIWSRTLEELGKLVNDLITEIDRWSTASLDSVNAAAETFVPGVKVKLDLSLKISIGETDSMVEEMRLATERYVESQ
jgi:hypothetical protein